MWQCMWRHLVAKIETNTSGNRKKLRTSWKQVENIARGTTDPGHWVYDLNNLSDWNQSEIILASEIIQVSDSIPWVLCASGNLSFSIFTCISSNFGHQVAPLALPHCQGLPYQHHQLVLSWYPHQPESHQLSLHMVLDGLTDWVTSGPIDRTPGTPGSDKHTLMHCCLNEKKNSNK